MNITNVKARISKTIKLVFFARLVDAMLGTSTYGSREEACIFLNWLSGSLVGVGGSEFIGQIRICTIQLPR